MMMFKQPRGGMFASPMALALMLAPSILILFAVVGYPLIFVFKNSFFNWNLQRSAEALQYIGIENYRMALFETELLVAVKNSLIFGIVCSLIQAVLGLAIALLLVNHLRGVSLVRLLIYIPVTLPPIVVGFIFRYALDPSGGIVPFIFTSLGIPVPDAGFLGDPLAAMIAIIIAETWEWSAFFALFMMAGLLAIPQNILDAARVDGASRWQILLKIQIPFLWNTIVVLLTMRFILTFGSFDIVEVMTKGGPGTSTRNVGYELYQQGIVNFNIGLVSASSCIVFIVVALIVGIFNHLAYRELRW